MENTELQAGISQSEPFLGSFCFVNAFAQKGTVFEEVRKEEQGGGEKKKKKKERKLAVALPYQAKFLLFIFLINFFWSIVALQCCVSTIQQMAQKVKKSACNVRHLGSIPGLGKSLGGGHGNPFQYSCLESPHGQRSLTSYRPWGHQELDTTE